MNSLDQRVRIVFLEDDPLFAEGIVRELVSKRYEVSHFTHAHACMAHLVQHGADVCLFDLNLPDASGAELMQRLQELGKMAPVIFLTGVDSEEVISKVLLAGADDYVIKPPNVTVLHARIQALLRRAARSASVNTERVGPLEVDYVRKTICRHGTELELTEVEAALALYLIEHRGQLVTRQALNLLLGVDDSKLNTRRLDVHLSHVRKKLGFGAEDGWRLASIYGRGYRLERILE